MNLSLNIDPLEKKMYPFKKAKLITFDNDIGKDWYVEYYVWHVKRDQLIRRRDKKGINRFKTISDRIKIGYELVNQINDLLKRGFVAGREKITSKTDLRTITMLEGIDLYLEHKRNDQLNPKTLNNYEGLRLNYIEFAKDHNYTNLQTSQFNSEIANEFMSWFVNEKQRSTRTRNNYLATLKMVIKHLSQLDNTIWKANPTAFINKLTTESQKHSAYSDEQMSMIKKAIIKAKDHQLLLFIQFIYYLFVRPGREARFIKLEHLEKERLYVPGYNSKNRKGDWISIPKVLQQDLDKLNLRQYPGHYYLFSVDQKPGEKPVGQNYFYKRYRKILKATKLAESSYLYDIYGFKHSGNIKMYKSGIPLDVIQKQNRHHSIDQTNEYLRDLDLFRNNEALDKLEGF